MVAKNFSEGIQNASILKQKIDELDFVKIKKFDSSKPPSRENKQATNWDKILTTHIW